MPNDAAIDAKARELLAATIDQKVFPGKAEHLLSGGDDLLFDAGPALRAIVAALREPVDALADAVRTEPCPACNGEQGHPGSQCVACLGVGTVRWTSANVIRNMLPWLTLDPAAIRSAAIEEAANCADAWNSEDGIRACVLFYGMNEHDLGVAEQVAAGIATAIRSLAQEAPLPVLNPRQLGPQDVAKDRDDA